MNIQNDKQWIVMKFGGSSVSSASCWPTICDRVRHHVGAGKRVVIVVSALSGTTKLLTRLADNPGSKESDAILFELREKHLHLYAALGLKPSTEFEKYWHDLQVLQPTGDSTPKAAQRALLLAHGELLSSLIAFEVLAAAQLTPLWQDARELLEAEQDSSSDVLAVRCGDHADLALERRLAEQGDLHITQGFIVSGPGGTCCLLGQGWFRHFCGLPCGKVASLRPGDMDRCARNF